MKFLSLFLLAVLPFFSSGAWACKVYSAQGVYRGLVDAGVVYDSEGVLQGRASTGTVYDVNHVIVGKVRNGAIYDAENFVVARVVIDQVYNSNGGRLGRGEACRVPELGVGAVLLLL